MNISGTTNRCVLLSNEEFILSGLSLSSSSSISIIDENGLDVSDCFNITTNITTLDGVPPTTTGACETMLVIEVDEPDDPITECSYTGYTQQEDGLILLEYADGTTDLNVHPDCCESLGFESKIEEDNYYICRWRAFIDPSDCKNYEVTGEFDEDGYMLYDYPTGRTNVVPKPECCYNTELVEVQTTGGFYCIEEVIKDCGELVLVTPVPDYGDIPFYNPATDSNTTIVEFAECCTEVHGFNVRVNGAGFTCYKDILVEKPTVTLTNDTCCKQDPTSDSTTTKVYTPVLMSQVGSSTPEYICLNADSMVNRFTTTGGSPRSGDTVYFWNGVDYNPFNGNDVYYKHGNAAYLISNSGIVILIAP